MIAPTLVNLPVSVLEQMHRLLEAGAPYRTLAAVHRDPPQTPCAPWFRNFWALGESARFPGAQEVFEAPELLEAAREASGCTLIRPLAMMTNLNLPSPAAPVHRDLPFYRGAHQREVPSWLLAPMGVSGLFDAWSIPVASALIWFYHGEGGGFEYWPNGLDRDSIVFEDTGSGCCLIADNEALYHRVARIGREGQALPGNRVPYEALLHRDTRGWSLRVGDDELARYAAGEVRASVLWKAYAFRDAEDARFQLEGGDRLTPQRIVETFQEDLESRGIRVSPPESLTGDDDWGRAIRETYRAPQPPERHDTARASG